MTEVQPKLITKNCTVCDIEISWQHKHKPEECPSCGEQYFDKPQIEIDLFKLQSRYLDNNEEEALGEMYSVITVYAENLIKNIIHSSYYMDVDILETKAHEAATKFIEYYLTNPAFRMERSFGAYLKFPIRNVLYASKKIDRNTTSFNTLIDHGSGSTFEDILESMSITTIYNNKDREDATEKIIDSQISFEKEITSLIHESIKRLKANYSTAHIIRVLIGVKLHFDKISPNMINDYYNINHNDVKENIEKIMMLTFQYLKSMEIQ